MLRRISILVFGLAAYVLFLFVFLYGVGFVGGFLTPTNLDGPRLVSLPVALCVDIGLLALFALQHSGMARPGFKRWLTRLVPTSIERSCYVLLSSVAMILLYTFWQPLGGVLWDLQDPVARALAYGGFAMGWLTVLVTTCLINHLDLFGVRQVWLAFRERPYTPVRFRMPGPYRFVRHPLYVGWLLAFWATPTMSVAHLLFALGTTAYILIAIVLEERDLMAVHAEYAEYRRRVPMLIPNFSLLSPSRPTWTESQRPLEGV